MLRRAASLAMIVSSSSEMRAPVGLHGGLRMMPRVVAVTLMVGELEMRVVRSARDDMGTLTRATCELSIARSTSALRRRACGQFREQALLDHVRYEPVHAPAKREHLFDQPRAGVGVL